MVCNWHLKDTRWDECSDAVRIHTIVAKINKYEFCMIDYTVNSLNGYKHEWTKENINKALKFIKPYLKAMGIKGKLEVYGVEFPRKYVTV